MQTCFLYAVLPEPPKAKAKGILRNLLSKGNKKGALGTFFIVLYLLLTYCSSRKLLNRSDRDGWRSFLKAFASI